MSIFIWWLNNGKRRCNPRIGSLTLVLWFVYVACWKAACHVWLCPRQLQCQIWQRADILERHFWTKNNLQRPSLFAIEAICDCITLLFSGSSIGSRVTAPFQNFLLCNALSCMGRADHRKCVLFLGLMTMMRLFRMPVLIWIRLHFEIFTLGLVWPHSLVG